PTTPITSTQTAPATPAPVPSTASISAFKQPKGWTSKHWILASIIALFLLSLGCFLIWPRPRKTAMQGSQAAIANPATSSTPAEAQLADQGNAATQFSLGVQYEFGRGVAKDLGKAAELYQKAADKGY